MSFPPPIRPAQSGEPVAPRLTSRWFNTASAAAAAYARNGDGPTGGDITAKPLNPGTTCYIAFGSTPGDYSAYQIKAGAVLGYWNATQSTLGDEKYGHNATPIYESFSVAGLYGSGSDSPYVGAYGTLGRAFAISLEAKSPGVVAANTRELIRAATSGQVTARVNVRSTAHRFARLAVEPTVTDSTTNYPTGEDPSVLHSDWFGPFRLNTTPTDTGLQAVAGVLADQVNGLPTVPIKITRKDGTRDNLWWGRAAYYAGQSTQGYAADGNTFYSEYDAIGEPYDLPVVLLNPHPFDVSSTDYGSGNVGPYTTTNPPYGVQGQLTVGRVYNCQASNGYGGPYSYTPPQCPGLIGTATDELDITSATNDVYQDITFTPDIWTPEPYLVIANVDVRIDPESYAATDYNEVYVVARLTYADGTPVTGAGAMSGALMAKGYIGPNNIAYPYYGTYLPVQKRAHVTLFGVVSRTDQFDATPTRLKIQAAKYDQGQTRGAPYDSASFFVTGEAIAISLSHVGFNYETTQMATSPPPAPAPNEDIDVP